MGSDLWPCAVCHSLNVAGADRCYSCRSPRVAPGDAPSSTSGAPVVTPRVAPRFQRRTLAGVAVLAVAGGALAALVAVAAVSRITLPPPAPSLSAAPAAAAGTPALAAEVSPGPPPPPTPAPPASPWPSSSPSPSPTPVPSPSPAYAPFLGRFSGTWLLTQTLGEDAAGAGAYASETILRVRPLCTKGACGVTASLVNPRTGRTLATTRVKRSKDGYRIMVRSSAADLCRGSDGRTVQGGATRTTSYVLRPFVSANDGGATILVAEASLRMHPNRRGDSVGCPDGRFTIGVDPVKLSKAEVASVKQRLSRVPQPDLVPRPSVTVAIKGVRTVTYPVKGAGASLLENRWAATSSKKKYCGKIQYTWHTGSRETLSCIKSTIVTSWSYAQDPWTGTCTITSFSVRIPMTFTIARWTSPALVPRGLATWWKAMLRHVRDHEAGHVAINRKWAPILRKRMIGQSCTSTGAIATKWSKQVNAAQEAYDKREYARTDWPAWPADAP